MEIIKIYRYNVSFFTLFSRIFEKYQINEIISQNVLIFTNIFHLWESRRRCYRCADLVNVKLIDISKRKRRRRRRIFVCLCKFLHLFLWIYSSICVCMCVCDFSFVCICICVCMHTWMVVCFHSIVIERQKRKYRLRDRGSKATKIKQFSDLNKTNHIKNQ